jgi:hypothetical protein
MVQLQNEAKMPGQPVLEDNETDSSSLDDVFLVPPPSRAKLPLTSKPKPVHDPSLLAAGRRLIETRNEALTVPFTQVSDAIRHSLENAEKTKGGPKKVLAELMKIARQEAVNERMVDFNSDGEENPNGNHNENLLECIRCVMVVEASSSMGPMENDAVGKRIEDRRIKSKLSH